ncbi:MAG: GDP-mannose 4,6-dehydratase [bacterium]|nr:GDP-mannose 4,6-dehydratase [bacterium]
MKVLITGITGFVGSHLAEYILKEYPDVEVFGTRRWRSPLDNIEHIREGITLVESDLRDPKNCYEALDEVRPERIFHLAAQSYVPSSWRAPSETITTNIVGNVNILEAMRELKLDCSIQIAGSSEEYGFVAPEECPIKESNTLRPLSPYGVSKVGQDLLGYQYFKSYGMHTVRTRGFNHTGPRRAKVFVCSNFALQIVEIEKGLRPPVINVGDLTTIRDFTDVRDMVRGYWLSLEHCEPGDVYNITSGNGLVIGDILETLIGLSDVEISIEQDAERMRPSDVPRLIGDYSKFNAVSGWEPVIPFEQTLSDILEFWRERV